VAVRALVLDDERVRMLREVSGTLELRLGGAAREHRLTITLGPLVAGAAADCQLDCALDDLFALQGGEKNAFELMMDGKVKITGNAQLAMVLGAALG
jgi:putative sterol carrier protein